MQQKHLIMRASIIIGVLLIIILALVIFGPFVLGHFYRVQHTLPGFGGM